MKRLMILVVALAALCSCGGEEPTQPVIVIEVTATPTPMPPTDTPTPVPPTDTPTHTPTPVPPTVTAAHTPTPVPPTVTPAHTPTPKSPTNTAVPPTATPKPPTATSPPRPTATPTEPPAQPPSQGCYLFQNFLDAAVTVTLTAQEWAWNDTFTLQAGEERAYCLDPGRYTYTIDAPPPWGSTNGELLVNAGDRYLFPIRGRE
jgi:hypothetical protein